MVEILSGFAVPLVKIAQAMGIDLKTLLKHYEREIAVGASKVEATLIGNLLTLAKGTDGTALKAIMFALNCRFGWSQYDPRPAASAGTPLGKKASADLAAQTAHEDDEEWGKVLN